MEKLAAVIGVLVFVFFAVMVLKFNLMVLSKLWLPILVLAGVSTLIMIVKKSGNRKDDE